MSFLTSLDQNRPTHRSHEDSELAALDHLDDLRQAADDIRQRMWAGLPAFLGQFADTVLEQGGHIHWAMTATDACRQIHQVVVKGADGIGDIVADRSRIFDEIGLRRTLRRAGIEVVDPGRRTIDIGVTGAELAVAQTGSVVLAYDKGIGRLVHALARVQVVVVGVDQLIARWPQAELMLAAATTDRLTPAPAINIVTGPRDERELDGPEQLHVIIVDNGRSGYSQTRFRTPEPLNTDSNDSLVEHEQNPWRLWATAWSDAERYTATTHVTSWPQLVAKLEGWLPAATSWQGTTDSSAPDPQRFRDHWQRGWV